MKIAIIQFPGANDVQAIKQALVRVGLEPVDFLWNEKISKLKKCDAIIIASGIFYNHYQSNIMAASSPVMQVIIQYAEKGKPVLGIGDSAQLLLVTGLVPGLKSSEAIITLSENKRVYFDKIINIGFCYTDTQVRLHEKVKPSVFTTELTKNDILHLPIAQASSRFLMTEDLQALLEKEGLIVFQYCDAEGEICDEFPINPNASVNNIAAISNYAGNVLAMVPRLERSRAGDSIFSSMRDFLEEKETVRAGYLSYTPRSVERDIILNKENNTHEIFLSSPWLDKETISIQYWLAEKNIIVTIKRFIYWEIACSEEVLHKIEKTSILASPRKAKVVARPKAGDHHYLVRDQEDLKGAQKWQLLVNHFEIDGIQSIHSGELWSLEAEDPVMIDRVLATGILFNPCAQICLRWS